MKQKMNVNGDIESRRRIAERRSVPARENISPDNSQQYHETEKDPAAATEENRLSGERSPKARRREDRRGRLNVSPSTRPG